jgi:hypothetical protein
MAYAVGTHKRALTKPCNTEGELVEATIGTTRNGTTHNERGYVLKPPEIICDTHSACMQSECHAIAKSTVKGAIRPHKHMQHLNVKVKPMR